jgi:phage gpG-like protein
VPSPFVIQNDFNAVSMAVGDALQQRRALLRKAVLDAGLVVEYTAKAEKLSGQVLHVRTNRLRNSVNRAKALTETENSISTSVGTNVPYGRVHEYGGAVNVPAHQRRLTMVFGRTLAAPKTIRVRAHTAHFAVRSFLRSALREKLPTIRTLFEKAGGV